jgi:hypothetical protein
MTQRDNILQELKELESSLANLPSQNIYTVPTGYFEGLAAQVLNKIKALEAATASDELSFLSPSLNNISKEMPFAVPSGYFEGLNEKVMQVISQDNDQTAKEELEALSPLLSGLKKEMPYSIPAGYFDSLKTKQETKVVSITSRKWFRYAAAAMIVGVVATAALLISNNSSNPEKSLARFVKKLDKEIKKTSDKELTEFVELTEASKDMVFYDNREDVKELLKDVPAAELQEFLEEIADPDIDNNNTSLQE